MDTWEHFRKWVVPDYNNFLRSPSDFRLLENAILSMYAEVEYLGLHQRGYLPVFRATSEMRDRYVMILILLTYRFAPIHSNMCGPTRMMASRCPPLALTPITQIRGK